MIARIVSYANKSTQENENQLDLREKELSLSEKYDNALSRMKIRSLRIKALLSRKVEHE
tara:strand:- start:595 stop:771 length:177 start_codon:yes stop_codon:yes gene_type:complete